LELRKCFDQYDTTNNGTISYDEFMAGLKDNNYSEERVKDIFESMDINKNGVIMYTEFIAATLEAQGHIEEERVAEAFDRIDSDDSGFISKENLAEFLGEEKSSSEIREIIADIDKDGDGQSKLKFV
jgi:Ca2+-binding EF-hand superfamily protein